MNIGNSNEEQEVKIANGEKEVERMKFYETESKDGNVGSGTFLCGTE